jgi:hypothetical protein
MFLFEIPHFGRVTLRANCLNMSVDEESQDFKPLFTKSQVLTALLAGRSRLSLIAHGCDLVLGSFQCLRLISLRLRLPNTVDQSAEMFQMIWISNSLRDDRPRESGSGRVQAQPRPGQSYGVDRKQTSQKRAGVGNLVQATHPPSTAAPRFRQRTALRAPNSRAVLKWERKDCWQFALH